MRTQRSRSESPRRNSTTAIEAIDLESGAGYAPLTDRDTEQDLAIHAFAKAYAEQLEAEKNKSQSGFRRLINGTFHAIAHGGAKAYQATYLYNAISALRHTAGDKQTDESRAIWNYTLLATIIASGTYQMYHAYTQGTGRTYTWQGFGQAGRDIATSYRESGVASAAKTSFKASISGLKAGRDAMLSFAGRYARKLTEAGTAAGGVISSAAGNNPLLGAATSGVAALLFKETSVVPHAKEQEQIKRIARNVEQMLREQPALTQSLLNGYKTAKSDRELVETVTKAAGQNVIRLTQRRGSNSEPSSPRL